MSSRSLRPRDGRGVTRVTQDVVSTPRVHVIETIGKPASHASHPTGNRPLLDRLLAERLVDGAGLRQATLASEMREAIDWLAFVLGPRVRASYLDVADEVDSIVFQTLADRWPKLRVLPDEWTRRRRRIWPQELRRYVDSRGAA